MEWNLDKLSKTLSRAGQGVSERVKGTAELVQTRQKKASAENELDDLFAQIGRNFYEQHREDAGEAFSELFEQVGQVTARIEAARTELNRLRGTKICPECGAEIAPDALFCSKCGAAAPIAEEPKEEEPAQEPVPEEEPVEVDGGDDFAQEVQETVGEAKECACETAEEVQEAAEDAAEEVQEAAEEAVGEVQEAAEEAVEEASEQVNETADAAREKAQKAVDQVAEAAEKAVDVAQDLAKEAWVKAGKFASDLKDRFKSGE